MATGPTPRDAATKRRLERQGRRDTAPELAVRRAVHARGLRYRVDQRPSRTVSSRADLVFPRQKVAVYVNGCFWHGCLLHASHPRHNARWWRDKIAANRARDERIDAVLVSEGWEVVRIWEHDDPERAADVIAQLVTRRRSETA